MNDRDWEWTRIVLGGVLVAVVAVALAASVAHMRAAPAWERGVAQRLDILESAAFAHALRLAELEAAHAGVVTEGGR